MKFLDRMLRQDPVWRRLAERMTSPVENKGLVGAQTVAGAAAGDVAVSKIKYGDHLVNVTDLSSGDLTSQFSIARDGYINNTSGASTATHQVLVVWEAIAGD